MNKFNVRIRTIAVICMVILVAGLFVFGINNNKNRKTNQENTGTITVAASFYPLYDFAKNIAGDKARVSVITPAGAEPHDYEPSPQQLTEVINSTLFIYNGGNFEPWAEKFVQNNKIRHLKASADIGLETEPQSESGAKDGHGEQEGELTDPHVWLDPKLANTIASQIAFTLGAVDPANRDYYTDKGAEYSRQLRQLNDDFESGLANCQSRTIVTAHDAFGYLAKRYNLEVLPIAGLSPEAEPSAATLAELSRLIKDKGITTIFFESLTSPRLAETLAKETGAKTAVLDPIEGISDEDQAKGKDYLSVQRENLQSLRTALACQ